MELNWTDLKDRIPTVKDGFNSPYIPCIVYSCNPSVKFGGVIETCRWDVGNKCWFKSDIDRNWYLQKPYEITHFIDNAKGPYGN